MISLFKKRWYVVLVLIIAAGSVLYQGNVVKNNAKKESVYKVKKKTLKETLSLSGKIDATEKVTLRFQTSGKLTWVGVKEGDFVKKYQVIAALDQREVKRKLEKELNTYLKTRNDFDQTKEDNPTIINDKIKRIVDKTQIDLNKSVLDVEIQNLAVEFSNLITPIEGIVVKVGSPFAGVNVTPTQAEFEIVNPKTVYFSSTADQTDVAKLKKDMQGEISFDAYPDKKIAGNVTSVAFIPKSGETGTVYEVRLQINEENSDYKFRMEMTGDTDFILRKKEDIIGVPTSYIRLENGKKYVIKLENGKKIRREIKIGDTFDTIIEVTSGITDGDIIL